MRQQEFDVFDMPVAGQYRVARPPLAHALVRLDFPLLTEFQTLTGVAPLRDKLKGLLPYMARQQVTQMAFTVNDSAAALPSQPESTVVWRFSDDNGWILLLTPENAVLNVGTTYAGIDDFTERFAIIVSALHDLASAERCDRLGVRFVNIVSVASDSLMQWTHWFRPSIVGWLGDKVLAAGTQVTSQVVQSQFSGELSVPGGTAFAAQALIRHGLLPPATLIPGVSLSEQDPVILQQPSFILDIDFATNTYTPFDPNELTTRFRALHAQIDQFFRWSLTPDGEKYFGVMDDG